MISLSLFFFNLLPLSVLDGGHLLETSLKELYLYCGKSSLSVGAGGILELEELESGVMGRARSEATTNRNLWLRPKRILCFTSYVVGCMGALLVIDALIRNVD
jgi:membrane-associated protease RseP (regulator of RpoE activity)